MGDTTILTGDLAAAVAEVQGLVAGDGARLDVVSVSVPGSAEPRELRLALDLSAVECIDCVLPPAMLAEVVTGSIRRRAGDDDLTVVVDDPREASA